MCVALGNIGDPVAVPALAKALQAGEPLVREHAAWALGKIGGEEAQKALSTALETEIVDDVTQELDKAIEEIEGSRTAVDG